MSSLTPLIGLRADHFRTSFLDHFRATAAYEGDLSGGERRFEHVAERSEAALESVLG
jgi:hypothetical protein